MKREITKREGARDRRERGGIGRKVESKKGKIKEYRTKRSNGGEREGEREEYIVGGEK